ncbi:MAG: hypothetical protein WCW87_00690 [Candidatus Paceibacterota bacterium]
MLHISDYFKKIKDVELKSFATRDVIVVAVLKVIGLKLEYKDITIKNRTVYLKVSPLIKNEVYINKKAILEEINKEKMLNIDDIR